MCCSVVWCNVLQCSVLQCVACIPFHCHTLQHIATHCNTLQHTATHCNTLQHFATHCNATFLGLRSMCIFMSVNIYICIHVIYSHTKFPYDRYQAGHRLPQIAHMPLCVHMYIYVYMNICHILIDWISISTISSWLPRIAPACMCRWEIHTYGFVREINREREGGVCERVCVWETYGFVK